MGDEAHNGDAATFFSAFVGASCDPTVVKAAYSEHDAAIYEKVHKSMGWIGYERLVEYVMPLLEKTPNAKVLDFGAGTGWVGEALACSYDGSYSVDALDISPELLGVAKTKGVYSTCICGLLGSDVTLPDKSYDAVLAAGVIGTHVDAGTVKQLLLPLIRPNGFLAFTIRDVGIDQYGFTSLLENLSRRGCDVTVTKVGALNDMFTHSIVSIVPGRRSETLSS